MSSGWLVDTSVLARMRSVIIRDTIRDLGMSRMFVCPVSLLEVGVSARSGDDYDGLMDDLFRSFRVKRINWPAWDRALEVQGLLVRLGLHRSAKMPDLLIAAAAELHDLTVLHCDKDFETVAQVTGQPTMFLRDSSD